MPKASNQALFDRLLAVECGDSTMRSVPPVVLKEGRGSLVIDADGREYIDLCAGFGALALGHNDAELTAVLANVSLVHGMGDVYPSEAKVLLLESLANCLPPEYTKGALALSGGQAVEIALKTAFLRTGRSGVVSFDGGYHGLDLGLLPIVSRQDFVKPFAKWLRTDRSRRVPFGLPREHFRSEISSFHDSVGLAAVVVEPIQGRGGVIIPPEGWLDMIVDETHRVGGLVVFDEVLVGLGRTGRMTFAGPSRAEGVSSGVRLNADLLCFGKTLGGGMPLSACFGTRDAMSAWPESRGEAIHTGTFFGHPLSCALGIATLRAIQERGLPDRAKRLGENALLHLSSELKDACPRLVSIRGQGLMIALEFQQNGDGEWLMHQLRHEGVIALVSGQGGRCLSLTPALNIPESEFESGLTRVIDVVKRFSHT